MVTVVLILNAEKSFGEKVEKTEEYIIAASLFFLTWYRLH
jgi:uncharacterized membrane protein (DUF485 family)